MVCLMVMLGIQCHSCFLCLLQCISATYYGLFDGHAGHTVSLIASKLLHMLVKVSSYPGPYTFGRALDWGSQGC